MIRVRTSRISTESRHRSPSFARRVTRLPVAIRGGCRNPQTPGIRRRIGDEGRWLADDTFAIVRARVHGSTDQLLSVVYAPPHTRHGIGWAPISSPGRGERRDRKRDARRRRVPGRRARAHIVRSVSYCVRQIERSVSRRDVGSTTNIAGDGRAGRRISRSRRFVTMPVAVMAATAHVPVVAVADELPRAFRASRHRRGGVVRDRVRQHRDPDAGLRDTVAAAGDIALRSQQLDTARRPTVRARRTRRRTPARDGRRGWAPSISVFCRIAAARRRFDRRSRPADGRGRPRGATVGSGPGRRLLRRRRRRSMRATTPHASPSARRRGRDLRQQLSDIP